MDTIRNTESTFELKRRPLWLCLILSACTLTVYLWVWLYFICKDSDKINGNNSKLKNVRFYWAAVIPIFLGDIIATAALLLLREKAYIAIIEADSEQIKCFLMDYSAFVKFITVLIVGCGLYFVGGANLYVLYYRIGKKIDGHPNYYLAFMALSGMWIVNLFIQDMINQFAGVYKEGEKPCWFPENNKTRAVEK